MGIICEAGTAIAFGAAQFTHGFWRCLCCSICCFLCNVLVVVVCHCVVCPSFVNLLYLVTSMVSSNFSYISMINCGEDRNVLEITQRFSNYLTFKSLDFGLGC
jgi:hypothetical protein